MAVLTPQTITQTGLAPAFTAAASGGDSFANNGNAYLHVKNGSASPVTVTVNSVEQCNHGFDHDLVVSVPASGERIIGPFEVRRFNGAGGTVGVTYSATTSVTVAVFKL